jgi:hypothetical protein
MAKTLRKAPVRASELQGFPLDVKATALRELMTETNKTPSGYTTFYVGTQAELVKAGIPEYAFPSHDRQIGIRANGQQGYLQRKGRVFELVLLWDHRGPWYHSAAHPALSELARMIHCNISYWINDDVDWKSDEIQTQKLLECERAVDYRLPAHKRFRFASGFRSELLAIQSHLYNLINSAEIMPLRPAVVQYEEPQDELKDLGAAQALLATIGDKGRPAKPKSKRKAAPQ